MRCVVRRPLGMYLVSTGKPELIGNRRGGHREKLPRAAAFFCFILSNALCALQVGNPKMPEAAGTANTFDDSVDVKLFKSVGLYYLLRPVPADGPRSDHRCLRAFIAVVWSLFGLSALQFSVLYFVRTDLKRLINLIMLLNVSLTTCFKGYVLIGNADRMWAVLELLGRYAFTTSSYRDPSELIRSRAKLSALTRTFVAFTYSVVFVWIVSPFFIETPMRAVRPDGTVAEYRMAVLNMWTPLQTRRTTRRRVGRSST